MNAVDCLVCGTRIESKHVHDLRCCKCPSDSSVFVDGGPEYKRRGWGPRAHWRDVATGNVVEAGRIALTAADCEMPS